MAARLRITAAAFGLAALASAPALGEPTIYTYDHGAMSFACSGAIFDGFVADGESLPEHCPPDAGGACIGDLIQSDVPGAEGITFRAYGGVVNSDGSIDRIDITIVRLDMTELVPGTYAVDIEETALIVYYDDADEFFPMPNMPPLVASAEHLFIAEVGSAITFTEVSEDRVVGWFTGTMFNEDSPGETISIDTGTFTLERNPTPFRRETWTGVKRSF